MSSIFVGEEQVLLYPFIEKVKLDHKKKAVAQEEDYLSDEEKNMIQKDDDGGIKEELNNKLMAEAATFIQTITCGICYGIITPDKRPV